MKSKEEIKEQIVTENFSKFIQEYVKKSDWDELIDDLKKYRRHDDYAEFMTDTFDTRVHSEYDMNTRINRLHELINHDCNCDDCSITYTKNLILDKHELTDLEKWWSDLLEASEQISKQADLYIENKGIEFFEIKQ